ncbi:MAG: OsmC family protein [Ginsengibacter sp.]
MAVNTINAVFKSGMNFTVDINGHKLEIDTDEAGGGNNTGTRPKVLMLASLAGCTGFDIVSILNKMRVKFSEFSIKVDGHLTEAEPKTYDEVVINYTIKVNKADEFKVEKAVKLSKEKYCGVSKMFESFAKVGFKIIYL